MTDRKLFYRKLWRLMFPIALQSLMLAAVAAADAIMLGRVEQNSMAAVSLATQVQFIQNMILSSVTASITILGAQYWGKQNIRKVVDILSLGMRIAGLASVLVWAFCLFFPEILMGFLTNEPELIAIGCRYLRIASWSYLLTGFSQCYLAMMKVSEHAARAALISSVTVLLNIFLNAVFIFGLFGTEARGAAGAAVATLIARIIELTWAVVSSYQKDFIHPELRGIFIFDRELSRDFRKISLPVLGACLLWGVGFTSYTAILGHMGTDAAAANSVSAVVRDLLCCLCNGLSAAGGIVVGNELGAGSLDRGKEYGTRIARIAVGTGLLAMFLGLAVTVPVTRFMVLTDEARDLLLKMMIIMSFYMIGRCINAIVINGIFGAGGDTLFDMYSLVVMMWMFAIPLAFCGAFFWGWSPVAVYACTCLDEVGKLPWVYAHFKKYKWVRDLTR